jgi:hypothetical protein
MKIFLFQHQNNSESPKSSLHERLKLSDLKPGAILEFLPIFGRFQEKIGNTGSKFIFCLVEHER